MQSEPSEKTGELPITREELAEMKAGLAGIAFVGGVDIRRLIAMAEQHAALLNRIGDAEERDKLLKVMDAAREVHEHHYYVGVLSDALRDYDAMIAEREHWKETHP